MLKQAIADMKSIYITILLIMGVSGVYGSAPCKGEWISGLTQFENINSSFTVNISGSNITIYDKITHLRCDWGAPNTCYVQCEFLNATKNLSSLLEEKLCVITNNKTQLDFILNKSNTRCNVTYCTENTIWELMDGIYKNNAQASDLKRLLNMKKMCSTLFANSTINRQYIRIEKKCIHDIIRTPFEGQTKNYDLEDLAMTVFSMNTSSEPVNISTPQVSDFLQLVNTVIPMEPFQNVSEEWSKVAIVTYSSAKQFMTPTDEKNVTIVSSVIRIEVVGRNIRNLTRPLSINFTLIDNLKANSCMSCQYYDDNEEFIWKGQEPQCLNLQNYYRDSNIANCSYDHMTPFAVLLIDVQIDKTNWKILSYITYTGCGISSVFSAAAIIVFMIKKTPNADSSNSIHTSLSTALLLLNVSFLFSEWAATWSIEAICVLVAVAIEYSLLCCFSWMAIEAMHVYLLLIKVFNTYIKHYMIKLSLFGWGVPAVLVGVSLSVYNVKAFYGTKSVTFSDTSDETKICWVTDVNFLYGMNIVYFSFIFLLNLAVLSTVTCQICKLRRLGSKSNKLPTCKDIITVLGMTSLLGITWGLAFLASGFVNYPILYLFCICNALQGFFMFLWVYGTIRKNQRQQSDTLTPSKPYSYTDQSSSQVTSNLS